MQPTILMVRVSAPIIWGPFVHRLGTIHVCQGDSGTGGHVSKSAVLRGAGKAPGYFKMCDEICTVLPLLSLPVVS